MHCVVAYHRISFFVKAEQYFTGYIHTIFSFLIFFNLNVLIFIFSFVYHVFFLHSYISGHLAYLYILDGGSKFGFVDSTTVDMSKQISLRDLVSNSLLGYQFSHS